MITIARVDFEGLKVAVERCLSVRAFNEQYIGYNVPYADIVTDMITTGNNEDEALQKQRELQWLSISEFQLLKAFFGQTTDFVTYDRFRRDILPNIRGFVDPFYRDRNTLHDIGERYGWESHTHIFTFKDITDEYITEGLVTFGWCQIKQIPLELEKKITKEGFPNKSLWDCEWENIETGAYAIIVSNQDGTRDLYIF